MYTLSSPPKLNIETTRAPTISEILATPDMELRKIKKLSYSYFIHFIQVEPKSPRIMILSRHQVVHEA